MKRNIAILLAVITILTTACAKAPTFPKSDYISTPGPTTTTETTPTLEPTPNGSWDEDIGYVYFKGFTEDDVAYDGAGVYYVKNQILVSAEKDLTFKDVSEIVFIYNAEIVGYLEMANQYQIETRTDVTLEELNRIITELNENPDISLASLNTASGVQSQGDGVRTKTSYRTPKTPISLEGYEPCAILYITSGGIYGGANYSGVLFYADGSAVRFESPSDAYDNNINEDKLVSDPESLAVITPLQSPDMETVDDIFSLLKDVNPNAATRDTEEIPTESKTTGELYMDYDLWGYYVNSEGEYQRLLLDSKGNFFSSLLDPNSNKICTWFFEQQSAWDLDVYEP